ncbi:DUF2804 family protein [Conexibacter sp. SYSU D00693]|uniref:DUF2804 family protein n=1 Tax=Conexibacter sp. SYSU D00693 TaxID=2812560 RepID=UPI00196B2875|nr:DUF2804 family protein [Conexibacter sp. SYSU D00693]
MTAVEPSAAPGATARDGVALPWRGVDDGSGSLARPPLPLPPGRMPLLRARRPRKSWRYVGLYAQDVLLCAGRVSLGGAPQTFWAVWDRGSRTLRERTRFVPGGVEVGDRVRFGGRGVRADLALEPRGEAVEVVSPHGPSWIWTRKQGARVHGTLVLDGRRIAVDGPALIDDSAGFHARETRWSWSAGAGVDEAGRQVLWNLCDGVHDDPAAGECTVWVDGVAVEAGPVRFDGLDAVHGPGDEVLRFAAEAQRARHDRLVLLDSAYRQPFGAFTGTLPGGVVLARGAGVMERHDVRW